MNLWKKGYNEKRDLHPQGEGEGGLEECSTSRTRMNDYEDAE
jgi:hypothetical protein